MKQASANRAPTPGDGLHPLSHANLFTEGGVTKSPWSDVTGDHPARIQADP